SGFQARRHKSRLARAGEFHHLVAMFVVGSGFLVRRIRRGHEQHTVERKSFGGLARHHEMRAVNGIERTSQDRDSHLKPRLLKASATAPLSRSQSRSAARARAYSGLRARLWSDSSRPSLWSPAFRLQHRAPAERTASARQACNDDDRRTTTGMRYRFLDL